MKKHLNFTGRLNFHDGEEEMAMAGTNRAFGQTFQSVNLKGKASTKNDKKQKIDLKKLTDSQKHLYMVMSSVN